MPADNAADVAPAQNSATQNNADAAPPGNGLADGATGSATAEPSSSLDGVLNALGIDGELRDVVLRNQEGSPEGEPGEETPAPETDPDEHEDEDEDEDEEEQKEEPETEEKTQWPKEAIALKEKYRRQRNEARTALETAQEELAQLKGQLESSPPVTVTPTMADPLAHVQDMTTLERERAQAETLLNFCEDKLDPEADPVVIEQGTANEHVATRQELRNLRRFAQDVLQRQVPLKAQQLQVRPQFEAQAKALLPTMFDRGHADFQASQNVLRENPWLANDPQGPVKIAIQLIGWKQVLSQTQGKNGNGSAPAKGNGSKLEIPPAILEQHENRGKIPVLRNSPPNRPSGAGAVPNRGKAAQAAMDAVIAGEDGAEGIGRAFAAARASAETATSPRSPALV